MCVHCISIPERNTQQGTLLSDPGRGQKQQPSMHVSAMHSARWSGLHAIRPTTQLVRVIAMSHPQATLVRTAHHHDTTEPTYAAGQGHRHVPMPDPNVSSLASAVFTEFTSRHQICCSCKMRVRRALPGVLQECSPYVHVWDSG